jgi:phospholipase C
MSKLNNVKNALLIALCALLALISACSTGRQEAEPPGIGDTPKVATLEVKRGDTPLKHLIVIFQENHSFDNYFGTYPHAEGFIPLPGTPAANGVPSGSYNLDDQGNRIDAFDFTMDELKTADVRHSYDPMIDAYDNGKMDRFAKVNGKNGRVAMGRYDYRMVTAYWQYAQHFAMADNFYQPIFGGSTPAALYLIGAQSGNVDKPNKGNPNPAFGELGSNKDPRWEALDYKTVGDLLDAKKLDWAWYHPGYNKASVPTTNPFLYFDQFPTAYKQENRVKDFSEFNKDVDLGKLPSVAYIKSNSEHPGGNGTPKNENFSVNVINKIMNSKYWRDTAVIVTYDESGGYWDHVPPPQVEPGPDGFKGLGPRIPLLLVSPYAKRNYIGHVQYDLTSIIKLIAWNFDLPSLNNRDANANNMLDLFDFSHPDFAPYLFRYETAVPPSSSYGVAVNIMLNNVPLARTLVDEPSFVDKSGKTMIPVKDLARNVNATVHTPNDNLLMMIYDKQLIVMKANSDTVQINGAAKKLGDKLWKSPKNELYISLQAIGDLPGFTVDTSGSVPVIVAGGSGK